MPWQAGQLSYVNYQVFWFFIFLTENAVFTKVKALGNQVDMVIAYYVENNDC